MQVTAELKNILKAKISERIKIVKESVKPSKKLRDLFMREIKLRNELSRIINKVQNLEKKEQIFCLKEYSLEKANYYEPKFISTKKIPDIFNELIVKLQYEDNIDISEIDKLIIKMIK